MKPRKKIVSGRIAPNDEYFWYNRHELWKMHPDMIIEEPEHLKRKRLKNKEKQSEENDHSDQY